MSSKPRILTSFLDGSAPPFPDDYVEIVEKHFEIVYGPDFKSDPKKYQDIVAIIYGWGPNIDEELLDQLPNLKIVSTISVGYNHLDIPLLRSRGIQISHTADVTNNAVAEFGITLMLAAARNLVRFGNGYKDGIYAKSFPDEVTPQFSGSTLGIVGMGRIGFILAKRAKAFDVKILYHNRSQRSTADEELVGATYFSNLNEMLPHCDFVMVLVNLTPETTHIMGKEQFKLMKKTAILSNCSRGATVDQDALVEALKSGEIYGAALDVVTPEPLPNTHEFFKLPNVILTPHISWQTRVASNSMTTLAVENVVAALEGRNLPSEVPY